MTARALLGATLFALFVALIAMFLAWPRSGMPEGNVSRVADRGSDFGRGIVLTANKAREVVVPGEAVSISVGPRSILDTSVSAFTRGPARGGDADIAPNSRLIGTARFEVALDSRRWYSVRVGDVLIATTGALFSIRLDLGDPPTTSVAVEAGEVAIQRIAGASNHSEAQRPSESALVYDLVAGNVGWWSDSLPPHVVTSVQPDQHKRRPRSSSFGGAQ